MAISQKNLLHWNQKVWEAYTKAKWAVICKQGRKPKDIFADEAMIPTDTPIVRVSSIASQAAVAKHISYRYQIIKLLAFFTENARDWTMLGLFNTRQGE